MELRDHEHQELGITWNLGILVFVKLGSVWCLGARKPTNRERAPELQMNFRNSGATFYFWERNILEIGIS